MKHVKLFEQFVNESTLNEGFKSGDKLKHKHDSKIEIELIEPTNKGWKVYQIENGKKKIAYFDKQDISGEKSLFVNEGRIALNHVYANAPVRNKVLEILKNGRVTEQDFMDAVSKAGAPDKWIRRNSHFFKVEEEDGLKYYSLSKTGNKVLEILKNGKITEQDFMDAVSKAGAPNKWLSRNSHFFKIEEEDGIESEDLIDIYEEFGLEENLIIDPLDLTKDLFYVSINGKTYGYQAKPGEDIENVATTFKKMLKYSAGKALAWLKKNSDLALGAGGSGPLREGKKRKP